MSLLLTMNVGFAWGASSSPSGPAPVYMRPLGFRLLRLGHGVGAALLLWISR